jgi:quercetin dioxygenase-like cupin family protein
LRQECDIMTETIQYAYVADVEPKKIAYPGFLGRFLVAGKAPTSQLSISYLEAEAGAGHDAHAHEEEEIIFIIEGAGTLRAETMTITLKNGTALHIPSSVPHAIQYKKPAKLIVIKKVPLNKQ